MAQYLSLFPLLPVRNAGVPLTNRPATHADLEMRKAAPASEKPKAFAAVSQ
jgi:hypothetical protein